MANKYPILLIPEQFGVVCNVFHHHGLSGGGGGLGGGGVTEDVVLDRAEARYGVLDGATCRFGAIPMTFESLDTPLPFSEQFVMIKFLPW